MKKRVPGIIFAFILALLAVCTGNLRVYAAKAEKTGSTEEYEIVYSNFNEYSVENGAEKTVLFHAKENLLITSITTYHWNRGRGAEPGTISILEDGKVIDTWEASARSGSDRENVYWDIFPDFEAKEGHDYEIADSDPATWSCNELSDYEGFIELRGIRDYDPGVDDAEEEDKEEEEDEEEKETSSKADSVQEIDGREVLEDGRNYITLYTEREEPDPEKIRAENYGLNFTWSGEAGSTSNPVYIFSNLEDGELVISYVNDRDYFAGMDPDNLEDLTDLQGTELYRITENGKRRKVRKVTTRIVDVSNDRNSTTDFGTIVLKFYADGKEVNFAEETYAVYFDINLGDGGLHRTPEGADPFLITEPLSDEPVEIIDEELPENTEANYSLWWGYNDVPGETGEPAYISWNEKSGELTATFVNSGNFFGEIDVNDISDLNAKNGSVLYLAGRNGKYEELPDVRVKIVSVGDARDEKSYHTVRLKFFDRNNEIVLKKGEYAVMLDIWTNGHHETVLDGDPFYFTVENDPETEMTASGEETKKKGKNKDAEEDKGKKDAKRDGGDVSEDEAASYTPAAYAISGGKWEQYPSGEWMYVKKDGTYAKGCWVEEEGQYYCIDYSGYLLKDNCFSDGFRTDEFGIWDGNTEKYDVDVEPLADVTYGSDPSWSFNFLHMSDGKHYCLVTESYSFGDKRTFDMTPLGCSCYLLEDEEYPDFYLHMFVSEDQKTITVSEACITNVFEAK